MSYSHETFRSVAHSDRVGLLLEAAAVGDLPRARALLEATTDPNGRLAGMTPLMMAASAGNAAMARLLIDAGASWQSRDTSNGKTVTQYAAESGNSEVIKLFQQLADAREKALREQKGAPKR